MEITLLIALGFNLVATTIVAVRQEKHTRKIRSLQVSDRMMKFAISDIIYNKLGDKEKQDA